MKKILLLADYSKESERRLLRGMVSYANENGGCTFHRMSSFPLESQGHSKQIIDAARKLDVDAVFGIWMDPTEEAVKIIGKPVVLRTIDTEYPMLPMLSGRYNEIGEMAADFFIRQHYRNVAFIGFENILWSDKRWEGFRDKCVKAGLSPLPLFVADPMAERGEIEDYLEQLPKPVGIFACNDAMAVTVSEICQFKNINVPDDVALLGADNDIFLCNITYPTLSSINLDFERQGYRLCETIFKMVDEGKTWPERIPIEPTGVVERGSTIKHNTKDKYVLEALNFMDSHYTEPIGIADVVKDIPLSRRAIEMRFVREMAPLTMNSYLNSLRVGHMCRLLENKEFSVSAAAAAAGFPDPSNVGRIFHKEMGMSPRDYALKNGKRQSG